jgi:lycopene beta-cyclase
MAACALLTLPLEWIGAGVYRRPARLVRALAAPVALFLLWDAAAIARGHWWFAPAYVTGIRLPFEIPLEEVVFFVVVPLCTLLTYEAVRCLLPAEPDRA